MKKEICYVPPTTLESFIKDVFIKFGTPADEAAFCAEVLISADLRGVESHGIGRIKYYFDRLKTGQHRPLTNLEIVRESPTTAVVDGNQGMGMIVGKKSMQMAIEKARKYGMGAVAARNSTHFGIAGFYSMMAVKEGMIGMTFCNARPAISPTFGVKPMLGTNPIAFGAPSDEEFPFIYDAATSITQRGKVEVASRAEKPIPEGWVIDQYGQPDMDPNSVLDGLTQGTAALLPLGGFTETLGSHKGYGLATMVEILSASLQTGAFLYGLTGFDAQGNKQPYRVGQFFMAMNVENFTDLATFKHTTGEILRELRAADKAPGVDRIYTAGEKEFEMEKLVRARGVSVNPNLQDELNIVQKELGLTTYQFPWQ
jgi:L-2-hydroxycarboxylate dehydrogenase (NAD+)